MEATDAAVDVLLFDMVKVKGTSCDGWAPVTPATTLPGMARSRLEVAAWLPLVAKPMTHALATAKTLVTVLRMRTPEDYRTGIVEGRHCKQFCPGSKIRP